MSGMNAEVVTQRKFDLSELVAGQVVDGVTDDVVGVD